MASKSIKSKNPGKVAAEDKVTEENMGVLAPKDVRTDPLFSAEQCRVAVDLNMVAIVRMMVAKDKVRLQSVIDEPSFKEQYFMDRQLTYMGRKAILTGAWECLDVILDSCSLSRRILSSFFLALCDRTESRLSVVAGVQKDDAAITITAYSSSPARQESVARMCAAMVAAHAEVLAEFKQVRTLLLATKTNGKLVGLGRMEMVRSFSPLLARMLHEADSESLSDKELVDISTTNLDTANSRLPFLPPIEHLWAAASRVLQKEEHEYNKISHNSTSPSLLLREARGENIIDAIVRRHTELVRPFVIEVEVHMIPDLANMVGDYLRVPKAKVKVKSDDSEPAASSSAAAASAPAAPYLNRSGLLDELFPSVPRARKPKRKAAAAALDDQ